MAVVLIGIPLAIGFGCVVGAAVVAGGLAGQWRFSRNDRTTLREIEVDVTAQVDRKTDISSGWKIDGPAAGSCSSFNSLVDRGSVNGFAIAFCSIVANVEDQRRRVRVGLGKCKGVWSRGCGCSGKTHAAKSEKFAAGRVERVHRNAMLAEATHD